MKINVVYIISDIDKAIAFEWIAEALTKEKTNLSFILIDSEGSYLSGYLKSLKIPVYLINCKNKKNMPFAVLKCRKILTRLNCNVVHCHLFKATIIGLASAILAGVKKRIYSRHHSTYHHTYFSKFVKWDKLCNFLATDIIAISENVKEVLINLRSYQQKK